MDSEGKRILQEAVSRPTGLFSPADMINGIAKHNEKAVNKLVSLGYLEEVPTQIHTGTTLNFYRVTEQGMRALAPLYTQIWFAIKNDIRTIAVSAITALITSIVTIFINNYLSK